MIIDRLNPTRTGPEPAADLRRAQDASTARLRHERAMPMAGLT